MRAVTGGVEGVEGGKGVENRDICARVASWNMANNRGIFIQSRLMSREYMHRVFTLNHNQTGKQDTLAAITATTKFKEQ